MVQSSAAFVDFLCVDCNVFEICALLGYYTASSSNFLLKFRDNLSVPSSVGHADVTYRLSRNLGKKLPLLAAW